MKQSVLFCSSIFLLLLLSSCGIYEDPCEGVGQVNISHSDS